MVLQRLLLTFLLEVALEKRQDQTLLLPGPLLLAPSFSGLNTYYEGWMKYHLRKTFVLCKKKAKSFVKLRRLGGVSVAGATCRNPERREGSLY
jgi:hypothetical protein